MTNALYQRYACHVSGNTIQAQVGSGKVRLLAMVLGIIYVAAAAKMLAKETNAKIKTAH